MFTPIFIFIPGGTGNLTLKEILHVIFIVLLGFAVGILLLFGAVELYDHMKPKPDYKNVLVDFKVMSWNGTSGLIYPNE